MTIIHTRKRARKHFEHKTASLCPRGVLISGMKRAPHAPIPAKREAHALFSADFRCRTTSVSFRSGMPDRNNTNRVRRRRSSPEPRHSPCQYGRVLAAPTFTPTENHRFSLGDPGLAQPKIGGCGTAPTSQEEIFGLFFSCGTQAIVYILSSFGCAKAPKRIAPRLVRIIPGWHTRKIAIAARWCIIGLWAAIFWR